MRDAFVEFLGNNENNIAGDNYAQERKYLDASFSYKLPMDTDISISLEVQNILNEQLLTYFRSDEFTPRASFAPGPPDAAGHQRFVLSPKDPGRQRKLPPLVLRGPIQRDWASIQEYRSWPS